MTVHYSSKKKKKKNWMNCPCASTHWHFCPLSSLIFFLQFSLHFGKKTFLVSPGKKHLDFTIYFPSSPSNQTHSKKVFLRIFSLKLSIHHILLPNKHTLGSKKESVPIVRKDELAKFHCWLLTSNNMGSLMGAFLSWLKGF